jgi:serine/threonine protein kinase
MQSIDDLSLPTRDLDACELPDALDRLEGPRIGDTIDGIYRVCGLLGSGGMGTVYLARDTELQREVAVKMIHADKLSDQGVVRRFSTEARTMARVRHPNVVTIHALGLRHHRPYLVMEYVPGMNLAAWRQERGILAPADAVAVLDALCRGVQAIHDAGAIHRDLKPGNVLIGAQRVAVTDFGLARTVAEREPSSRSMLAGTPAYLAPEIARGEWLAPELATRIDIYALGVMAFELLTGQPPFAGPGVPVLLNQHAFERPPVPSEVCPSLPQAFDAPLLQALAKAPGERPASAEDFRSALLHALETSTTEAPQRLQVLVVDDDARMLLALRELLPMSFPGVEVITVTDPASALSIARRERPDLVITDLHMPRGGGLALTTALRRDATTKDVPIVVVTAYGGASDWHKLKALGADRCLLKPIDVDVLVSVVRSLLGRRGTSGGTQAGSPVASYI